MVRVCDLDIALDFYCDKLGFVEINRHENNEGKFTLIFLAAPDDVEMAKVNKAPLLELTYNWDKEKYDSGRNFGHLAYQVDNIYQVCQQLMSKGITINRPPKDGYMAFIKSPDGISIEILQKGKALALEEPWQSMENTGSW